MQKGSGIHGNMNKISAIIVTTLIGFDVYDKNTHMFVERFQRVVELPFSENDLLTYQELFYEKKKKKNNSFLSDLMKETAARTIDLYLDQEVIVFEKNKPDQRLTSSVLTDPLIRVIEAG